MTTRILICFLVIGVIFSSCSPEEKAKEPLPLDALEGTWELVKYVNHSEGDTSWLSYSDNIVYQKHVTPTHFTWVKYNKSEDNLEGIGGGTYTFDGSTYTEDIKFFLPPGSQELGQAIPFEDVINEDGQWYHDGYAKQFEYDAEAGEMVVADSVEIEEIWRKVPDSGNATDLIGTWEMDSYRAAPGDSLMSEYPPFTGYIKHITPTHFIWVRYNKEGDDVYGAAGGTYTYNDGTYVENIKIAYPTASGLPGTSPSFTATFEDGKWIHQGTVQALDSAGNSMEVYIDEVWTKAN